MKPLLGQLDPTLERMQYGRALKAELLMEHKPDQWVPYAQPLLDAVNLFETLGIGYALIGGIAAMYYGRPRFTEDVDFVVAAESMEALALRSGEMNSNGVEIWKDEHADPIIKGACEVTVAGRQIKLIDPNDLVAMKLRAERFKDDYDISEMIRAGTVDEAAVRQRVTAAQFERYVQIRQRTAAE